MRRSVLALTTVLLAACSSPSAEPPTTSPPAEGAAPADAAGPSAVAAEPGEADSVAYFAGGCFWGVEHYMEALPGVVDVQSGYMGGHLESPTYEQVVAHTSGHLETVAVRFDSGTVSYEAVAKLFFEIHDPTQADGQGPDIGSQYLSAVFYTDDEQKKTTEGLIERLRGRGFEVVTEVRPADTFWPAEDYHQDYYARNGKTPYCHTRVPRFGD